MVKRKAVVEDPEPVKEVTKPKTTKKSTNAPAESPKASPVKKAAAKKPAAKTAAVAKEPVVEKAKPVAASRSRAKKVVEPKSPAKPAVKSPAKTKKAPAKTVAKETTAVAKTVKAPKPKTSPVKAKKVTVPKVPKVPKVATPEKKKPASRVKKAAANDAKEEAEKDEPMEDSSGSDSQDKPNKPSDAPESRKRAKTVKEVVAAKKPKIEVHVPLRHNRGSGVVLAIGQGDVGQLGLGPDELEKSRPTLVEGVPDIIDVAAGGMHTVCLTANGEVWTFGCNDEGALGRETSEEGSEFTPGAVKLPGKVSMISAGDSHTAALLEDGRGFIWGTFRDSHGPMGLNSFGSQKLPVPILEGIPLIQIASGADHFVGLSVDGQVFTCGCAEQGQLGRVAEVFSNRGGRKGKGYLLDPQPVAMGKGKKRIAVDYISTGSYATFVRAKDTGYIYAFGLNNYNQLGLATQDARFQPEVSDGFKGHRWRSISCGQHHTIALDEEGKVYSLGRKEYGRLGMGPNATDLAVPTPIPGLADHKCVEVAAGESVSLAVTETGVAYSWGMGTNGQLGQGDEEDVLEPKTVKGKQLQNRKVVAASAGGQHTVLLAINASSTSTTPAASATVVPPVSAAETPAN